MTRIKKSAEALNFESAARIRDQIAGLKSLNADQKVSLPDDTVSRDAIVAADEQHACIQLFQIRAEPGGAIRIRSRCPCSSGNNFAARVREHYQTAESVEIPIEILVQHELPDGEMLRKFRVSVKLGK